MINEHKRIGMTKFAGWDKSSLSRQPFAISVPNLFRRYFLIVPHSCDLVHCTAFLLRGSVRPPPTKKSGWAQFTASAPGRQEPYSYATDNGGVKKTAPGKNEKTRLQSLDTHTVIISSAVGWGHLAIPRSVPLSVPWRSCPRRAAALG